jgi:hypothetical protein
MRPRHRAARRIAPTENCRALPAHQGDEHLVVGRNLARRAQRKGRAGLRAWLQKFPAMFLFSRGYEKKDLELGPQFYLGQGVKDVIVFNPYTNVVHHFDADGDREYQSPITLRSKCGCQVEV